MSLHCTSCEIAEAGLVSQLFQSPLFSLTLRKSDTYLYLCLAHIAVPLTSMKTVLPSCSVPPFQLLFLSGSVS